MYLALIVLGIAAGVTLVARGLVRRSRAAGIAGGTILVATPALFLVLSLWGELLWFEALGYQTRFWTELWAHLGFGVIGAILGAGVVGLLVVPIPRPLRLPWRLPVILGVAAGAFWGSTAWDAILMYLERQPAGVVDPIHGRDASFYLFALPLYDQLYRLLVLFCVLGIGAHLYALGLQYKRTGGQEEPRRLTEHSPPVPTWGLPAALCALGIVLAWGRYLDTYQLLYSNLGAVTGPGWTDVHIRLPAYWVGVGIIPIWSIALLFPAVRRRVGRLGIRPVKLGVPIELEGLLRGWALILIGWVAATAALPALVQWLVVEPNEISFERPYIGYNIELTRRAFALDQAEEREFPVSDALTRDVVAANRDLLSEVRLWDWGALDAVYKQFQEIRLYYEFHDVDVDRYPIGERYRQVMVSAREMVPENLPVASQTFVNQRFKYTHGFGITLAPVSDFTEQGLPNLLVRDLPPRSEYPELSVDVPQIYYGELTGSPVYANTREEEFDHPRGDQNAFIRYDGRGGVRLKNLWRKFVYGWKFDGTRFFLSSYPREDSRVLFHREIRDRVSTLAPFLKLDDDPYVALVDGRLKWIVDTYTTSRHYPFAAPFRAVESLEYRDGGGTSLQYTAARALHGANYVRNSVKAVIDAFDGTVTFYVLDAEDPILRVWRRVFPDLFRDEADISDELRGHLRYPEDLLLAQGMIYAKYHMLDPDVFYNQEDLWVRATEKYYGDLRPVEPYYVMWQPPESDAPEFVLMMPFSPKNRQVLIGWIAGMCDPESYGRFLAYKFPKERRVLGPQQVETKIDQDSFLSGQLTLWDQRGSTVIRGNVLAIPISDTLLYVEPIYLRAETAAYPELRLVAVMHGDRLSYAATFEEALAGLLLDIEPGETLTRDSKQALERARQLLKQYRDLQGEGRFEDAGRVLDELRDLLEAANRQAISGEAETSDAS